MKAVFVLFDSLNRHVLGPYGGTRVPTPTFDRLAERSVTYDRHYVGSLPCMPARRDILSGRLSFLHRSWGPLEPFDNAFPELLHGAGVYSHLVTDHYHYWEDGGATYHNRYDSYEFIRGQEGDRWKAMVQPPWERLREVYHERQFSNGRRRHYAQDIINRQFIKEEEDFPSVRCFREGLDFLKSNGKADQWFLQVETFDPHEPFYAPKRFKEAFSTQWSGPIRDWPRYERVDETPIECEELRANYYAVIALCDHLLGNVLDYFDQHNLWQDTALVVTTDHGFLLGEHDFWAKSRMHLYEEIVHIPLFVYDPRFSNQKGARCERLTQAIDLAPTFLDFFGAQLPREIDGIPLAASTHAEKDLREAAIFGYFGGAVNVTDGRFTYHRFPDDLENQELYQYTLMPTHMRQMFTPEEMSAASLSEGFSFSKGARLLKVPVTRRSPMFYHVGPGGLLEFGTRLYDLVNDPGQDNPIVDRKVEMRMLAAMKGLMVDNDAPAEAFARLGMGSALAS